MPVLWCNKIKFCIEKCKCSAVIYLLWGGGGGVSI